MIKCYKQIKATLMTPNILQENKSNIKRKAMNCAYLVQLGTAPDKPEITSSEAYCVEILKEET